jgi:hypothetical protein
MSDPPPVVAPDATVDDAVAALTDPDVVVVVVADDGEVYGTVGPRDLVAVRASRSPPESPPAATVQATGDGPYSEQSICEACGALSRELAGYNGQLLCPDCRSR